MSNKEPDKAELYVKETRALRDEQGMDRIITMERIYWGSYDFIIENTTMTADELIAIGDESAEAYGMTFHDYFPEGLAHIDHYYSDRPELWNSAQDKIAGYIGPVSRKQIEELEASKSQTGDIKT